MAAINQKKQYAVLSKFVKSPTEMDDLLYLQEVKIVMLGRSETAARCRKHRVSISNFYRYPRVSLICSSAAGKSSLAVRFVHNSFTFSTEFTMGASYLSKTLSIDDRSWKINLWDTAGQER